MSAPTGRGTAVVVGAGIAGLAAARVLADRFAEVIVVDRDELPDDAAPRRGVPQGWHSHVLLVAGQRALGDVFPGLHEALAERGAVVFDSAADLHLYRLGAAWQPVHTGLPFVSVSRPLLEHTMRRQVAQLPQVTIRAGAAVSGLIGADGQVTGVVLDGAEHLAADLVVDATGRGSRSDRWLSALGYPTPEVEEVKVSVGYVSRYYRHTPGDLPVQAAFVQPTPPKEKRIGAALLVEDDRWLVSVGGWHGDYPPADEAAFLAHAESLPDPIIADLVRKAEPLTEPVPFQFPANRRRLFEQLSDVPGGYLAIGDAVSSFNPLYGQGMTVAAQQAKALGQVLDEHGPADADAVRDFYRRAAGIVTVPWQAAVGGDFDYPETGGQRPAAAALFGRYSTKVQLAAQISGEVRKVVLAVQHLLSPPTALWRPSLVAEVARASVHPEPGAVPEFGYGAHERPLWTAGDRDAERARAALRAAGFTEFTDEQFGFAAESGEEGDPVLVASLDGRAGDYRAALEAAGFAVTPDDTDPLLLSITAR
ncbi:NAD(P)/FAD-dependent oxidoreductase [Catellatospora vulcania]|uniref:NAD(P)/FAD-dependent oxidoreductase n=1 Tax=Catellatospora vulcania TaxID=1460450 RepID=UPI0012D3C21B|nr:FAD-dependent monooxygenase [Catellatospora vulcania]